MAGESNRGNILSADCVTMPMIASILLAAVIDLSSEASARATAAHLPAVQATVANARGLVAHGSAGVAVLGGRVHVTNRDAFHIGSCAKPFTATIVATLVEEGKLSWDTPIVAIFPEWKDRIRPEYTSVTMADLLSHESGLPPFEAEEEFAHVPHFTGGGAERRKAFSEYVLEQPPMVPPRTGYKYSNAGFVVAAAMAERVAGTSWESLLETRIFRPLGMRSAGIGWPSRVWGHEADEKGSLTPADPHGAYQLPDYFGPAGDLHMSTDDLAKFLSAHLRAMRGRNSLITPATSAIMHTKRIRGGLGFGVATVAGLENVATYSGSADTFFTVIAIAADEDVAVAVSTNAAGETAQKAVGSLLKDLLVRYRGGKSAIR
jgi:CubicO group peptidase (beta-lactamase class C family)